MDRIACYSWTTFRAQLVVRSSLNPIPTVGSGVKSVGRIRSATCHPQRNTSRLERRPGDVERWEWTDGIGRRSFGLRDRLPESLDNRRRPDRYPATLTLSSRRSGLSAAAAPCAAIERQAWHGRDLRSTRSPQASQPPSCGHLGWYRADATPAWDARKQAPRVRMCERENSPIPARHLGFLRSFDMGESTSDLPAGWQLGSVIRHVQERDLKLRRGRCDDQQAQNRQKDTVGKTHPVPGLDSAHTTSGCSTLAPILRSTSMDGERD